MSNDLSERLSNLQSCTVADVLDEMGLPGQVLSADIRPLTMQMKVVGPAFCIRGTALPNGAPPAPISPKPGYEMFRHMTEGCVAVLDTGGYQVAGPWGENTALSARMRGCAGVVIDGATRDALELVEMSFPAFVRFSTPVRVERRWAHLAFDEPITMPGQVVRDVSVRPGDYIVADADGVVVLPAELLEEVAEAAEEVTRIEERIREELLTGRDREDIYREFDRYAHIRKTHV